MKRLNKRRLGLVFWIVAIVGGTLALKRADSDRLKADAPSAENDWQTQTPDALAPSVLTYLSGPVETFEQIDSVGRLKTYDPIFLESPVGVFRQAGHVVSVSEPNNSDMEHEGERTIQFAWYDTKISPDECLLFQHYSTGNLEEVVETLFPKERQLQIKQRLAAAMSAHGDDLSRAFVPLVQQSLKRSMPVIEEELRASVSRHRAELDQLAGEWNDEIISKRLIPMARREILPIVRKHGQPPAEKIGREMWDRASLWRFGWRAVYDKTPLPNKGLVQGEWKRFVKEEAVPVIESHMDEIVVAIQRSLADVMANRSVRKELGIVADELAADPETRALVRTILKETLIENDRLRQVWGEVWTSDEAKSAIDMAGDRLEPVVRKIGDDLFGNENDGINPDFARVLRSQILGKDRRWVVAWHTGAGTNNGRVEASSSSMPYPIIYVAKEER